MALIHQATIRPTKLEALAAWVPTQPWFTGTADTALTLVASYRFDDPDGEVGIETLLVRAGGPVLQVPLTYRAAPLAGGDSFLITTMEHSVLGRRWVYDAEGDPVYRAVLVDTVLAGAREADQYVEVDGAPVLRESTATVVGSGPGIEDGAQTAGARLDLVRTPGTDAPDGEPATDGLQVEILSGTWTEHGERTAPQVLARVRARQNR
ncbi:CG0192-related protein [Sanguibacter antarcticus]|uniref:Maltokinase N-terminal cap domain-containing protein n=1 Tax=Sanguibacter antarcticus TaxID=372484 RepID=A0A2A9E9E6_9MICO|nr:hypothetical protein [Sanguibacter antarcticus]PFG34862.1 hypothetical protein ATL42_2793 [Sanguibacter antarcticus]